jgi:hypothetical protein
MPSTAWRFSNGEITLDFRCTQEGEVNVNLKYHDASDAYIGAKVWGRTADYYEDDILGGYSWLYWQGSDGTLFELSGKLLDLDTLERIANSVQWDSDAAVTYHMNWKPDGLICTEKDEIGDTKKITFADPDQQYAVYWNYSSDYELISIDGTPETVTVNGVEAKYWAPVDPNGPHFEITGHSGDIDTKEILSLSGGIPVMNSETFNDVNPPTQDQMGFLIWTDPATGIYHRLAGCLDKDTLIRMAESVERD